MLLFLSLKHLLNIAPKIGDTVYHVANPDVPGKIVSGCSNGWVDVIFAVPVGFSGNHWRGLAADWTCSAALLFPSSAEAWAHKRF